MTHPPERDGHKAATLLLQDLLKDPEYEPGDTWGGYNFGLGFKAVVAVSEVGGGCVLYTVGGPLRMEMEECGLYDPGDLGFDAQPPGIWVWEGKGVWYPGSWEHPQDGDYCLEGTFRPPTEHEWDCIQAGECPWDDAEYLTPLGKKMREERTLADPDG